MIQIANGGGLHPARNIVGGDFLLLVRLGIRDASDPLVCDSIEVIDRVLKYDLPQGPCWRRYNHDGYGQREDCSAFDGTGVGRCWPILTGERGHYELAAGRDPKRFIKAMEDFANQGGMITEQIWDGPDLPDRNMKFGCPTGAAMPLCWSHSEYVSLIRSRHDGVCFARVEPAYQRYVVNPAQSRYEIWTVRHPLRLVSRGKILRVILSAEATIRWSTDDSARANEMHTIHRDELNLWFADFPSAEWPSGSVLTFTFCWKPDQRWEGRNWQVSVF
jgi:glucoamylase